jgi:hypothetical protein
MALYSGYNWAVERATAVGAGVLMVIVGQLSIQLKPEFRPISITA